MSTSLSTRLPNLQGNFCLCLFAYCLSKFRVETKHIPVKHFMKIILNKSCLLVFIWHLIQILTNELVSSAAPPHPPAQCLSPVLGCSVGTWQWVWRHALEVWDVLQLGTGGCISWEFKAGLLSFRRLINTSQLDQERKWHFQQFHQVYYFKRYPQKYFKSYFSQDISQTALWSILFF